MTVYVFLGWFGTIVYLIAYALLSMNILNGQKPTYHLLNVIGALGLVINGIPMNDYPSIALNGVWGLIALITVLRLRKKKTIDDVSS